MGDGILEPDEVGSATKSHKTWDFGWEAIGKATQAAYKVWGGNSPYQNADQPGGSGGFEFPSAEEMAAVIGQWEARRDSITQKEFQIERIMDSLTELARDQESQGYLKTARESLELLQNQHASMLVYIEDYIRKLGEAKTGKQSNEDNTRETLTKSSVDPYR